MARLSVSSRWSMRAKPCLMVRMPRVDAAVALQHLVAQPVASADEFGAEVFDPLPDAVDPVRDAVNPVLDAVDPVGQFGAYAADFGFDVSGPVDYEASAQASERDCRGKDGADGYRVRIHYLDFTPSV